MIGLYEIHSKWISSADHEAHSGTSETWNSIYRCGKYPRRNFRGRRVACTSSTVDQVSAGDLFGVWAPCVGEYGMSGRVRQDEWSANQQRFEI